MIASLNIQRPLGANGPKDRSSGRPDLFPKAWIEEVLAHLPDRLGRLLLLAGIAPCNAANMDLVYANYLAGRVGTVDEDQRYLRLDGELAFEFGFEMQGEKAAECTNTNHADAEGEEQFLSFGAHVSFVSDLKIQFVLQSADGKLSHLPARDSDSDLSTRSIDRISRYFKFLIELRPRVSRLLIVGADFLPDLKAPNDSTAIPRVGDLTVQAYFLLESDSEFTVPHDADYLSAISQSLSEILLYPSLESLAHAKASELNKQWEAANDRNRMLELTLERIETEFRDGVELLSDLRSRIKILEMENLLLCVDKTPEIGLQSILLESAHCHPGSSVFVDHDWTNKDWAVFFVIKHLCGTKHDEVLGLARQNLDTDYIDFPQAVDFIKQWAELTLISSPSGPVEQRVHRLLSGQRGLQHVAHELVKVAAHHAVLKQDHLLDFLIVALKLKLSQESTDMKDRASSASMLPERFTRQERLIFAATLFHLVENLLSELTRRGFLGEQVEAKLFEDRGFLVLEIGSDSLDPKFNASLLVKAYRKLKDNPVGKSKAGSTTGLLARLEEKLPTRVSVETCGVDALYIRAPRGHQDVTGKTLVKFVGSKMLVFAS